MAKPVKIKVDIVLSATEAPDRELSPSRFARTLEGIICNAVQLRLPEYSVEIRSLKADWPGASENFPDFDMEKQ